jgi:hypothetical protein
MPTLRLASCADHRGAIRLDLVVSNATTRARGSVGWALPTREYAYGTVEARPGGLRVHQPSLNELGFGHAPDDKKDGSASSEQNGENVQTPLVGRAHPTPECFAFMLVGSARAVPTPHRLFWDDPGHGSARNHDRILYIRNSLTNRSQSALGTVPTMSLTASPPVAASR